MKAFFGPDSPFMQKLSKIGWIFIFGFLWLLCCLPVLTAGASTAAFYEMLFHVRKEKEYSARSFFQAFRASFSVGTKLWLIMILSGELIFFLRFAIAYFAPDESQRLLLLGSFYALSAVWVFLLQYIFPQAAYSENSVRQILLNAWLLSFRNLLLTVSCSCMTLLPLFAYLINPRLFILSAFLWIFIAPGLIGWWKSRYLLELFEKQE